MRDHRPFRTVAARPARVRLAALNVFTEGRELPDGPAARLARQAPPMHDRDELIFLLHTAAEIEHMLLVQYLYAAYSTADTPLGRGAHDVLAGVAREEMGHLLCVQNLLIALGGPLNFDREDHPFNALYPFRFRLEPLSVGSLARYVLAEMPDPSVVPPELNLDLAELEADAGVGAGKGAVNRVGKLFELAEELAARMTQADLRPAAAPFQADPTEWRAAAHHFVLDRVNAPDDLLRLLREIGAQGEGPTETPGVLPSHFRRFYDLYRTVKEVDPAARSDLAHLVPVDPTIYDDNAQGFLQNHEAAEGADLGNHRLRWLFTALSHHLQTDVPRERNALRRWAFEDMLALRDLSKVVTGLPQHDPPQTDTTGRVRLAALPFALPYTMALPTRRDDLWAHHAMLARHELVRMEAWTGPAALKALLTGQANSRLNFIVNL